MPHGQHGQTPGAPAASSWEPATPIQQVAWAHEAAAGPAAQQTFPAGINHVPLPVPAAAHIRVPRPGERPPVGTYAGAPAAAAIQAADAARPNVKLNRKMTEAQERAAKIAHEMRTVAAAAAEQRLAEADREAKQRRKDTNARAEALAAPKSAAKATQRAQARDRYANAKAAAAPLDGAARPRRAKLKINNSNLLMPFHDLADDPYFIRV